jgi:hypothetical protein
MKNNNEQHSRFNSKKSIKNKKKKGSRVSAKFARVDWVPDWPAGSTGSRWANFSAGFYLDLDRFQARVDPPGQSGFQNYHAQDVAKSGGAS